jgi:N-acetylglucosaminyldiphosphoundecaprenol N-acetyl-beta-D-mannosaminyltransferase
MLGAESAQAIEFLAAGSRETGSRPAGPDAFSRDVYCIQGLPIDAVDMPDVIRMIRSAGKNRARLFLSTPNLNFLIGTATDEAYRDTVIASDLNIADGMPLIWISRLLGLPIRHRVAGSDLLSALSAGQGDPDKPFRVMFFGGQEGAGAAACRAINDDPEPVVCTGHIYPGFKSVEELSTADVIDQVNGVDADFLIVALGARKGQLWLHRNADQLQAPVRSHLGALINMAAGSIRRAPPLMQKAGLEWLWRIREEPTLWRRYLKDGSALIGLMATRIMPLAVLQRWLAARSAAYPFKAELQRGSGGETVAMLHGMATAGDRDAVRRLCRDLVAAGTGVTLDMCGLAGADPGFFGLLLVLKKHLTAAGLALKIQAVSPGLKRYFRLNGVLFLLDE